MKLKSPVAVHWLDAHMTDENMSRDAVNHEPARQITIGFLVRSDKKGVSLAIEYCADDPDEIRTHCFIPRGMITRVQRLR